MMPEESTRRSFLTAAGTGLAAALAGCGGNAPDEQSTETATNTPTASETATATPTEEKTFTGGTLQMASEGPVQTLDPANAKGSGAGYNQYAESLMEFPNGDLPAEPSLATDYTLSNDGKTYTFELKEGVMFHNGDEMTADDVIYSWERLAGAEETQNADDIVGGTFTIAHEGNTGESVTNYVPGSLEMEAVDDYTFEFTLDSEFHASLPQIAGGAFAIYPENSVAYPKDYESHDMDGLMYEGKYDYNVFFSTKDDGPQFAATGPFNVDSWSKGDTIELSMFEDYHGEGPYIDGVTYTVIGEANTRFSRFVNGNLDILEGPPTAQLNPDNLEIERDRGSYRAGTYELDNGNTVNYGEATALDTDYIVFNTARTPKPVRKAFAYMINQHAIAEDIYKGMAEPAYSLTPPPVYMTDGDTSPTDSYEAHYQDGENNQLDFASDGWMYGVGEARLDDARQVMEDAGYSSDNPYDLEFTVFSGSSSWDRVSKRLRDKAQNAHINVDITKADFGTIITQAINGNMDMFSLGDGMEWPESDNFLRFIPPYENPAFMFTRWTHRVEAPSLDFNGNDVATVKEDLLVEMPDDVDTSHVSVSESSDTDGQGTAAVFIEDITADEFADIIDSAGYSSSPPESIGAGFDDLMPVADNAWGEHYEPHTGAGQENQQQRNIAYHTIEEVNWETVQEMPTVYGTTQRLWNPEVSVRMAGTMENQTFNTVTIERDN